MSVNDIAMFMIFAPLIASVFVGFSSCKINKYLSQFITSAVMILSAASAVFIFHHIFVNGAVIHITLSKWVSIDSLIANWAIYLDVLSSLMCVVVTVVSALVHIYSIGYMSHDENIPRFMSYISLFTFFMMMLVCSDNFIQLFFGWEGVGLSSYLLIGFWFKKPAANNAAMKAFIVNRVADIGLALGIFLTFYVFNSVEFAQVFSRAKAFSEDTIYIFDSDVSVATVISLLLFLGCMGKSAQVGFHTWLPDAMEGPTPVSALIHAATMVTAGVFMLARCSVLFECSEYALQVITFVGSITAIFGAVVALCQTDIKKIIAYSTCSQLGYMFFACGLSAYGVAIFHLATHAFFKALLFLSAGSVIHAMNGEQDITRMGGLHNKIPITYAVMWVGSLALAGIFPFSGFYSKDAILEAALNSDRGMFAYFIGIISAFLTALYSWRLIFVAFHGKNHALRVSLADIHESPITMLLPLIILSIGATFAGWYGVDILGILDKNVDFWKSSIVEIKTNKSHNLILEYMPMIVAFLGMISAWFLYYLKVNMNYPNVIASRMSITYSIIKNKFYFDEFYNTALVSNIKSIGYVLSNYIDLKFIDSIPNGIAAISLGFSKMLSKFQSGYLSHYIAVMIISVFILLFIVFNGLQLLV